MAYSFEWDPKKAASNQKDHEVSFDEARTVFGVESTVAAAAEIQRQTAREEEEPWTIS